MSTKSTVKFIAPRGHYHISKKTENPYYWIIYRVRIREYIKKKANVRRCVTITEYFYHKVMCRKVLDLVTFRWVRYPNNLTSKNIQIITLTVNQQWRQNRQRLANGTTCIFLISYSPSFNSMRFYFIWITLIIKGFKYLTLTPSFFLSLSLFGNERLLR